MISNVKNINIADFDYPLPEERIAKYPLAERDASKLLVMRGDDIQEDRFSNIGRHLPQNSLLVLNETKVVRARLQFVKDSGAAIEIFCLEPVSCNGDYQLVFASGSPVEWRCLVGNSRRWKGGERHHVGEAYDRIEMQKDRIVKVTRVLQRSTVPHNRKTLPHWKEEDGQPSGHRRSQR